MSRYTEEGFVDRADYLLWVAISAGVSVRRVNNLASAFGESEDFGQLLESVAKLEALNRRKPPFRGKRRNRKKTKL